MPQFKKYTPKKKLPNISTRIVIPNSFREKLFNEEVFDCIKANITLESPLSIENNEARKEFKKFRRSKTQTIREKILTSYSEEQLKKLNSRRVRREMRHLFSTEAEYNIFCVLCKDAGRKLKKPRRKKEKNKRKFSQYETYINSKAWEHRRNEFWQTHPKRCVICATAKFIHLHHMDYSMLEHEPDEHLVALCKEHHAQYHTENGVQKHMTQKTQSFIKFQKSLLAQKGLN